VEVTPTFFTLNGESFVGETFQMLSLEVKTIKLKTLMPPIIRGRRDLGGMTLTYTGGMFEMWGQLRLMNVNHGNSVDVTFALSQDRRSAIRNAVWWMPEEGQATIAIGNFGNSPLKARATFLNGDMEEMEIPSFGTHLIERKSKSNGGADGVTLEALGPNTDLVATGAVTSQERSFTSSIRFYDTRNVAQPNLYATNFRLKDVKPRLLLRNTSLQTISATPRFIPAPGDPNNFIDLPSLTLDPNQTADVDIEPLKATTLGKSEFDHVSIQVLNNGVPGSLIGALNGTDIANKMTYDVPLRDIGGMRNSTGAYPWRLDQDLSTLVSLTNTGTTPSGVLVQLNFPGGPYLLDPRRLAAGETVLYDLRKIRDEQIPDRNGRTIPHSVNGGQFKWSIYGFGPGSGRVIGRAEMISQSQEISSSYSCPGGNCPMEFSYAFLDNDSPYLTPGDVTTATAYEVWCDAYGCVGPLSANVNSWGEDDPFIAALIPNGSQAGLIGVDGGDTGFWANIGHDRWGWDGLNCYWLMWSIDAAYGTASVLKMDGISPSRGAASTTTAVTIMGKNFRNGASLVIDGTGVSASNVNVSSSTTITANLVIAGNAAGGNHTIKVHSNNKNSNGKNFFVQIPSKLIPFDHQLAPNGIGPLNTPVDGDVRFLEGTLKFQHFCGVYRSYLFLLVDQEGQKIQTAFTFDEIFTNVSSSPGLAEVTYTPVEFPSNWVAIEDLQSLGFLNSGCLASGQFQTFDHQFKITIGGTPYFPTTKIHIVRGNEGGTLKVDRTITTQ
jgi:hypothetical protein